MLLWLALGFAPSPLPLPEGAPTVHLARTPAVQWALRSSARGQAFSAAWGAPYVRWDERTGTPRFVGLPGLPEALADDLVADLARLSGVAPGELHAEPVRTRPHGDGERTYLRFTRTHQGAPVLDDQVLLVVTDGRIGAAWVRLTPTGGLPTPRAGEVVVADPARGFGRLVRLERGPTAVRAVDRAGAEVVAYDPRHYSTVTVTHEEYTVGDALVTDAARYVTVTDSSGATAVTAADGTHGLSGALSLELDGTSLQVLQNGADITLSGTDDVDIDAGTDVSYSAADTLHHFYMVWDWLAYTWPTHDWLDDHVVATVDMNSGACNAYYTSGTINFYAEYSYCNATGRMASVVYHETGHGIHEYILAGGTFASDVSEGSADYVSATILNDPLIGEGFYTDGSGIRELETDKVYPDDIINEPHNDGLIWASLLWNLRDTWLTTYGDPTGAEMTDLLFLGALEQGPELTDLLEATLVADDDNGDWSDGTPHDCELIDLFTLHGLGPGAMGIYQAAHTPLGPQASDTEGYAVELQLQAGFDTCTGVADPTPSVWYTNDLGAALPAADGAGAEAWTELPLTSGDGVTWSGTLPRVPATDGFRYYYVLTASDGSTSEASHGGLEQGVWAFHVGDRAELWCDDFESGAPGFTHAAGIPWEGAAGTTDEWTFGSPAGTGSFDPDLAVSGTTIATTVLDDEYSPDNAQHLATPMVDLATPGRMRMLTYQRWLTVEDGIYDHARVYTTDGATWSQIWTNAGTSAGDTQLLDTDWRTFDHTLAPFLDAEGARTTPLGFAFTLQSDGGLEFGGWALDDVCVVELDDVPDHYRRVALVAAWTDAGEAEVGTVDLTWHTPWIRPLTTTVLVRQEGRAPTSLTDGVILDLDLDPTFGEEKHVVDTLPGLERGTSWTYALFAAGENSAELYLSAVEGQNAATVAFELRDTGEPLDTADSGEDTADSGTDTADSGDADSGGDTGADDDTGEPADDGCGCQSGGAGSVGAALVLAAAAAARRRRA